MTPFRPDYGVFETMRTYGSDVFRLDEHLERLAVSAEIIGMKLPKGLDAIRDMILTLDFDCPTRVRVVATPDDIVIETYPIEIDPKIYEGVSAICLQVDRDVPEAKAFPYDKSLAAHDEAEKQGHYEALLVDAGGLVREGAYSNVFWVKDGRVFTAKDGVLKGVTRSVVMELTDVDFAEITPDEIKKVDEIFITKTTAGVTAITELDGVQIGDGTVGPVTEKLQLHFLELESKTE